jgi:hypothetical protein
MRSLLFRKWQDRAALAIAVLLIGGAVVYEIVITYTDFEARTQSPDAIISWFVATDRGGSERLVLLENVIVYGNKGDRYGNYRLRSFDIDTGEPGALLIIKHTRENRGMACARDGEGIFWCRTNDGAAIEMRSVDTLEIVQDFEALKNKASPLAEGIYKVLVDLEGGGVRVTTGRGDNVILRGAEPKVIPFPSGERMPRRFVPIGNSNTASQLSYQTEAGELWFTGHGKKGYALFLRKGQRRVELLGMTGIDNPGFLWGQDGRAIVGDGLVVAVYIEKNQLSFSGVTMAGKARWTTRAGEGHLIRAYHHADRVVAVAGGPEGYRMLSFRITDGGIVWKREL